jgi:hypothetical protein
MMPGLFVDAPLEAPMPKSDTPTLLRNLDRRVSVIEQILPTLATKDDLKDFPTAQDPKGFATKADLERFATKEDLREEGERSRRHMKMLSEDIRDTVNRSLEMQMALAQRLGEHGVRIGAHTGKIEGLDLRVTALEHPQPRRG